MSWSYRHSGLGIASNFEVPEWAAFAAPVAGAPDVVLERIDGPLDAPRAGRDIAFSVEGAGHYLVRDGRAITVRPEDGADPAQWRLFVLGSAWGALGYQRALALWHASAVARGGRAVLLCGASGAGKSTLAATLTARGGVLVADDLVRIDPMDGTALIHPSAARLKLWGEVVDHLGWRDRVLQRDWLRADKFHCAVPEHAPAVPALALAAIVVLEDGASLQLTRLRGAEALEKVMRATLYRPGSIDQLGVWPQQGALAARILAGTPAFTLSRPRDLARLDETAKMVETLWER